MTYLKQKLSKVPHEPGCYLYKDKDNRVIYVGKAKDLKKRTAQYFQKKEHDPKTELLVKKIADLEYIVTDTEVEALLLEQNLIHQYTPKYNIDLRDSQRYAYIKITDETYPRVVVARKIEKKGKFFGPYTEGIARKEVLRTIRSIFQLRTCVKMPKRTCLEFDINKCIGPCEAKVNFKEYQDTVKQVELFLKGQTQKIFEQLQTKMKKYSEEEKYELAKRYRDRIEALKILLNKQKIDQKRIHDQDYLNWFSLNNDLFIQVWQVRKGIITKRNKFKINKTLSAVNDFIYQYYSINYIPSEIFIPKKIEEQDLVLKYLKKLRKEKFLGQSQAKLTVPQKGDKKKLLDLIEKNLLEEAGIDEGIRKLSDIIKLNKMPVLIDAFDVSNLSGTNNVGACIRLDNNKFLKTYYRLFKIKEYIDQNDPGMINQIVFRRYRLAQEKNENLPDLILIDGGISQLNAGKRALSDLELNIPIISLAKKEEEIYLGSKDIIRLDKKNSGLKILIKARDEVHRFVIGFQRKRRKKT